MKTRRLLLPLALLCPSAALGQSLAPAEALAATDLRHGLVDRLELPPAAGEPFGVDVFFHGAEHRLELVPHSNRAAGFRLLVQGADGTIRDEEPAPVATYRGRVAGYPDSVVSASLFEGGLRAQLRLAPDLSVVAVQPLASVLPGADPAEHLVFDAADSTPRPGACGVDTSGVDPLGAASGGAVAQPPAAGSGAPAGGATDESQIACDVDFNYYELVGSSVFAAQVDVEDSINDVEAIYEPQTGIVYEITAILVRTAEPDPYSSSNPSVLLGQLESHWTSSQGSIPRDQTHLFTGRNIAGGVIGIAELNSICGNNSGYGLSEAKFDGANEFSSVGLIAHELGHNWSATHCDGSGSCKIMCSNINGCSGDVTEFSNSSVNKIVNKKNASGCLGTPAPALPQLDGPASPASVSAYQGGVVSIPGEQLGEVFEVRVGGQVALEVRWQSSFNELLLQDLTYKDVGSVAVEVTNEAGTVGGVSVTVLEATDIEMRGPSVSVPGFPAIYDWSGGADNTYVLNWALDGSTIPVGGDDVLANANFGLSGVLSPAGTGDLIFVQNSLLGFLSLHLQVLVFDPVSSAFLGATEIVNTIFL